MIFLSGGRKEEEIKLRDVPPLWKILGLIEGQMVIFTPRYGGPEKCVITELYDNYLTLRRKEFISGYQINMKEVESMMNAGQFVPLTKNGVPVMGRRMFLFFGAWLPR
jgi:hypothetical protein